MNFTPIRRRNLSIGVCLSSTVGKALGSQLFLTIALGSQRSFVGQSMGRTWMGRRTPLTIMRRGLLPFPVPAAS